MTPPATVEGAGFRRLKVLTILGTRPEIIRLSLIIRALDEHTEHTLVHTGQNYDERLDAIFFHELGVRAPDINLGIRGFGFGDQVGKLLTAIEPILVERRPDRLLILGDTNSGLAAICARRLGIPVYHMEAGNRCFDDRVPEEVNRRIIDHSSTVLLPYTERSRDNLLAEGFHRSRVIVTGNPIKEIIDRHWARITASRALEDLGVTAGGYILVTAHRAENVDVLHRLLSIVDAVSTIGETYGLPVLCSLHPRTRERVQAAGIDLAARGIRALEPLGFFDFVQLERQARCVLSDSGTVQEETCIFGVPNVTIRDVTERPETIECGSNYVAGTGRDDIVRAVDFVMARQSVWTPPPEYVRTDVADTVLRVLLAERIADTAELEWRTGARLGLPSPRATV